LLALTARATIRCWLAAAQSAFIAAEAAGTLQCSSTEDDANDRIEHRCGCVFPVPATAPAFPGLVAFKRINSLRTKRGGKTESKTQYGLSVICVQKVPLRKVGDIKYLSPNRRDRPEIREIMTIGLGSVGYIPGWGLNGWNGRCVWLGWGLMISPGASR
jgi:hypothetical protein